MGAQTLGPSIMQVGGAADRCGIRLALPRMLAMSVLLGLAFLLPACPRLAGSASSQRCHCIPVLCLPPCRQVGHYSRRRPRQHAPAAAVCEGGALPP